MTAPSPLTDEQVAEIRARVEAATEGPWHATHDRCSIYSSASVHRGGGIAGSLLSHGAKFKSPADAEFIAHARTDVPALLAEVERLTERLAEADSAAQQMMVSTADADFRARKAEAREAALRQALVAARDDIRARRREFRRLGADEQYLLALDDAFGLVANRALLAEHATPSDPPVDRCWHSEPEGECPSCAACAACRGECGTCPYATPSDPPQGEDKQRADHFEHLYGEASEGKCGYSGLTIGACKASICDCFEFPWVQPAPDEHPDPATPSDPPQDERACACGDWHNPAVTSAYGYRACRYVPPEDEPRCEGLAPFRCGNPDCPAHREGA